jgi:hypothetical protein
MGAYSAEIEKPRVRGWRGKGTPEPLAVSGAVGPAGTSSAIRGGGVTVISKEFSRPPGFLTNTL